MRPRRLGLRREVLILLPVALLVLVVLSLFTLFSFRGALDQLAADRREEAVRLAKTVAERLGESRSSGSPELRLLAPGARSIALVDASGLPTVHAGAELSLLPPPADSADAIGPGGLLPDTVAGFAPLPSAGGLWVRVDLGAETFTRQRRVLSILTASVLGIDAAVLVLVLAFLGHLMAPYEALLARARAMAGEGQGDGDEMQFLVQTFEAALQALAGRDTRGTEDDIAALERTLAPSLQSGLLLLDRTGGVLALNTVGAELLGVASPAAGTPLSQILAGQPELCEILSDAVATGSAPSRAECTVRSSDAATLTVGLTVHPLRRTDGAVRGFLVLFADLTEARRRAQDSQLAESLSRLGEMAGGIAHELRNSLATLSGYLTLIERRPDEESVTDYLAEIRHEADHLQRVLEDFLSFARPGSVRRGDVVLDRLLHRAAADPSLAGVEVEVVGDPGGEVRMTGDPQLLERVVRNLLHNAAEAEREAGRSGPVRVSVARRDDGVVLAIEDRGAGLPAGIRERLFHPFATGRRGGVGLGLALAHRIVVLHGGRIRLDDRPGGGTRAEIAFPSDTA